MPQISKIARDAVRQVLADPDAGFNAAAAEAAPLYGIDPLAIDWDGGSRNFFQGALTPADLDRTTPAQYPYAMLYTLASRNTGEQKFMTFSGEITLALDIYLSWRKTSALSDYEDTLDAVEDVVYGVINQADWNPFGLVWDGDIDCTRVMLDASGGQHWRAALHFRMTFELHTN
jgi:hypothetical protein